MRIPWNILPAFPHRPPRAVPFHRTHRYCQAMEWDAENGVWKNDKALAIDDVPDPLYIFGKLDSQ